MLKIGKHVMGTLLIIWLVFFLTDFFLAKANQSPIFAVPTVMYKDGGSAEYYGLGYKVNKYVNLSAQRGEEMVKTEFGTWFMKFSHPNAN